jgi:hypothetical protein
MKTFIYFNIQKSILITLEGEKMKNVLFALFVVGLFVASGCTTGKASSTETLNKLFTKAYDEDGNPYYTQPDFSQIGQSGKFIDNPSLFMGFDINGISMISSKDCGYIEVKANEPLNSKSKEDTIDTFTTFPENKKFCNMNDGDCSIDEYCGLSADDCACIEDIKYVDECPVGSHCDGNLGTSTQACHTCEAEVQDGENTVSVKGICCKTEPNPSVQAIIPPVIIVDEIMTSEEIIENQDVDPSLQQIDTRAQATEPTANENEPQATETEPLAQDTEPPAPTVG